MLKKLKSLFIVVDENESSGEKKANSTEQSKAAKVKEKPISKAPKTAKASIPKSAKTAQSTNSGKADPKFVEVLLKAIEANNLDGFDYLEFKQSLQNLSNVQMDEKTRYQSAFAMAKTMGATPSKLVNSAQHYINVLKKEEAKFSEALQNQRKKQVHDRENGIKQKESLIVEKQKKIEQLQKEIEADTKSLEADRSAINQSLAKVETTKNGFVNAYIGVLGQIKGDIEKMNNYIT